MWYERFIEQNKLPDFILRAGLRFLQQQRLRKETAGDSEVQQQRFNELLEELKTAPVAVLPAAASEPQAELPVEFYQYCLGKHLTYATAYWRQGVTDLDTAEEDMLELICQRADLQNGQEVLELGCGWGSLSLFMAAKYPASNFTVVAGSSIQKAFIDHTAKDRALINLTVITADINTFQILQVFDRVVAAELFAHVRNYKLLLKKIYGFLKEKGKLFVQVHAHQTLAYQFDVTENSDFLTRHFLAGITMPSIHLLTYFNDDLQVDKLWVVNGRNYSKSAASWLSNMDKHQNDLMPILEKTYGKEQSVKWWVYWRLFFMSVEEQFGYRNGNEWMVGQYLFIKKV